jgi:hypothetical protein
MLELSERSLSLPDNQISLAWSHLYQTLEQPDCPMPPELSNLTEAEWLILSLTLERQLFLRQHLPLQ